MHKAEIQALVREAYRGITTPACAGAVLYAEAQLAELPAGASEWSLGVGDPVSRAGLQPGETVVDVGSGAGIDTLLAARRVGPSGRAIGLDFLPEMCQRARANAAGAGVDNAAFVTAEMEAIPLADASVDVIVSNGVINLSARKTRVLAECFRVLRDGGRLCVTDITVDEDLPPQILTHPSAWAG